MCFVLANIRLYSIHSSCRLPVVVLNDVIKMTIAYKGEVTAVISVAPANDNFFKKKIKQNIYQNFISKKGY